MITATKPRGACAVGYLAELPALETTTVVYLRLWFSGTPHIIEEEFTRMLGLTEGNLRLDAFETLMGLIAHAARRPVMHHSVGCTCLGADECALAHAVAAAACGDKDDAMLFLAPLFPRHSCEQALQAAKGVGDGIAQILAGFPASHSTKIH